MLVDEQAAHFPTPLLVGNQDLSEWSTIGSIASEAACHRQKIELLGHAFLTTTEVNQIRFAQSCEYEADWVAGSCELVHLSPSDTDCSFKSTNTQPSHRTPAGSEERRDLENPVNSTSFQTAVTLDHAGSDDDQLPVFTYHPDSIDSNASEQVLSVSSTDVWPHSPNDNPPASEGIHIVHPPALCANQPMPRLSAESGYSDYANGINASYPTGPECALVVVCNHTSSLSNQHALTLATRTHANTETHTTRAADWFTQSTNTRGVFGENQSSVTSQSYFTTLPVSEPVDHNSSLMDYRHLSNNARHPQTSPTHGPNSPVQKPHSPWDDPVDVRRSTNHYQQQQPHQMSNYITSERFGRPRTPISKYTASSPVRDRRRKRSVDEHLSKMDQTLNDFTSHLSQIDSTLGRLKEIGSVSNHASTMDNSISRQSPRSGGIPSSTSTEEGKSFDCNPLEPSMERAENPHVVRRPSTQSSSLGASLTTLSSSVWMSMSPSVRTNGLPSNHSTRQPETYFNFEDVTNEPRPQESYRSVTDESLSSRRRPSNGTTVRRSSIEEELTAIEKQRSFERSHHEAVAGQHKRKDSSNYCNVKRTSIPTTISDDQMESESPTRSEQSVRSYESKSSLTYDPPPRTIKASHQVNGPSHNYPPRPSGQLHISSPELYRSTRRQHTTNSRANHHSRGFLPRTPVKNHQSTMSLSSHRHGQRNAHRSRAGNSSEEEEEVEQDRGGHWSPAESADGSMDSLTNQFADLLFAGREAEAREMITGMLRSSRSRQRLQTMIDSVGETLHRENQTSARPAYKKYTSRGGSSRDQLWQPSGDDGVSSTSLLRMAESLAALSEAVRATTGNTSSSGRSRGSYTSLLTAPSRLQGSMGSPRTIDRSQLNGHYHASSQLGSIGSLMSGQSVQFVQWPSDMLVEEHLPSMRPKPRATPPIHPKTAILPPPDVLTRLDSRVHATVATDFFSFTELVHSLTEELTDEVCIVRVLFIWTVLVDVRFKEFDPAAPPDSLIGMLRRLRNGQLTRNEILHRLCRFAGIHCQLITGYAKSEGYQPGMDLKHNRLFHSAWLAVHIAGGWHLINADWAVRASQTPGQEPKLVESNETLPIEDLCDEFHFLTDPEQHIFMHFPDNKAWQLLPKPINMERFVHLPLLKSAFFNATLSLKKNYGDCLLTSNGQVTVKLLMPRFVGISCSLENSGDHTLLHGLCLIEVLGETDLVRIQAAPSQPGRYYLHIYVAKDWRQEHERELACSFQIHCTEHNYSRLIAMGRVPEVGFLGPTPAARNLGVSMVMPSGTQRSSNGSGGGGRPFILHQSSDALRIPFAIAPGLKLCHQLRSFDRPGQQIVDCDSYALLQMRPPTRSTRNSSNAHYHIRMPVDGFYYLTIYATANDNMAETDHLDCAHRILIDARRRRRGSSTSAATSIGAASAVATPDATPAFPRQTVWWVQCYLHEPMNQRLRVGRVYAFRLDAPQCNSVAVVMNETQDWHFLSANTRSGTWSGRVNVGDYLGQLSVYGRFRRAGETFRVALGGSIRSKRGSNQHAAPRDDGNASDADEDDDYVKLLDYVLVE